MPRCSHKHHRPGCSRKPHQEEKVGERGEEEELAEEVSLLRCNRTGMPRVGGRSRCRE